MMSTNQPDNLLYQLPNKITLTSREGTITSSAMQECKDYSM
ncbi:hypothetical protein THOM_3254 [Trachipleistophora hominis]|uniref:Uncharacterized protein n=1 Tax=Trachipleistophora hominis TaxID=72359 RepID=L7JR15_TRAHO|nr:hypothetical protein THOM_3254 [Trachipleistophora hominis]